MDIFSVFSLCGGLAFFLFGMNQLSAGLEKMAGGRLESLLKKATSNSFVGMLLGVIITVAIQSSSAVTVMLVGLVNSGIMDLHQTVGIIMGSNIGKTVMAWILSLSGIESDNFFLMLLKPESFSPLLALIGIIMIMVAKSDRKKSAGTILVGFSILMYGMELMTDSVAPLADNEKFKHILTMFSNPILGVIVGAIFTAIIQSSAASVGILQAISLNGSVTYAIAIPIIMGQNIGTCITAILSSFGVNKDAKRVSVIHISFNLIGTLFYLTLYCLIDSFIGIPFSDKPIDAFGIAVVHSIFNIATLLVLMPFSNQLEKLAYLIVKDSDEDKEKEAVYSFIDDRLLSTPSVAIRESNSKCKKMANIARDTTIAAMSIVKAYDEKTAKTVTENEDLLDFYEDKVGSFLVKLNGKAVSDEDNASMSLQLHTIGDFERIGDHAMNILEAAEEIHEKDLHFSESARKELDVLFNALTEILETTTTAYYTHSIITARMVEPLEEAIDYLIVEIKAKHIQRLKNGECSIELGFVLSDLLTDCERISDHCSNVAIAIIETSQYTYDAHEYLNVVKRAGNKEFEDEYESYKKKYSIEA
ncbi:MAG: Na/Pi cotransporter family protein [Clostridia bacterium]|nr:Na/Pi cotransporter family protein [Clostridia bacterium]